MATKVLIMSGYGINCEEESKHAFELVGAKASVVHINDLIMKKDDINNYDIIMFSGGFSYGDDTFSGNAFANKIKNNLWKEFLEFIAAKKLILGVCNGFQVMTNLGLFATPSTEYGTRINALISNKNNRYECRWVNIKNQKPVESSSNKESTNCVFTKGIDNTFIPIAHGEGQFYCDEKTLKILEENNQIVFNYCDSDGNEAKGQFPINPNGSMKDIAGICDKTGRIMGMMPHPERAIYSINRPDFHMIKETSKRANQKLPKIVESNLAIFRNAVEYSENTK
jgi:phosphoribosylformylglycinamidine synthase I